MEISKTEQVVDVVMSVCKFSGVYAVET